MCVRRLFPLFGFLWLSFATVQGAGDSAPAALVARAGNTNDDKARERVLLELADLPAADAKLRAEAKSLAAFAGKWNGGSLKFYGASVRGKPYRAIADYDFGVPQDSALRPIAELYRGRMLAWNLIENSNVRTNPKEARWFKDQAVESFQKTAAAFPENKAARMYLGEAQPWGKTYGPEQGAPEWAVLQREQLERMAEIIRWWIANRQKADDGSFGGGWGDDCEMWRWWSSVLLGFDDPQITAAQLKFSKSAVSRPHLKGGFNTEITDVEHAAEDTTDNLIPLMVLQPDNERWTQWGLSLGNHMRDAWTGRNQRGQLQFKSFYFSATESAPQESRAYDVLADVGALHPALLAWQRTGDEKLGAQICDWLDTWVDTTARAENGKPAGILPASIRWPDGVAAGSTTWWQPVKPGGYMHSYYIWPSVITEMTDALMVAYVMTGKDSYLAPLRSMAAIRLKALKSPPASPPEADTEAWCGEQLAPRPNANSNTGGLVKSLARMKALTGTTEFDELIALEGSEFVIRTDAEGRKELEKSLRESLGALRVNFAGFTSEVRSTDRVMRFVQFLVQDYAFDEYKGVMQPKHELLYRMVTGDKNAPRFPQMAVRWLTPPKDMAVLVTTASTRELRAEVFPFGQGLRELSAELRQLQPGSYTVSLTADGRAVDLKQSAITVEKERFPRLPLSLPEGKLCVLEVKPKAAQ